MMTSEWTVKRVRSTTRKEAVAQARSRDWASACMKFGGGPLKDLWGGDMFQTHRVLFFERENLLMVRHFFF